MNEKLKHELLNYLGELMCEKENTFDWIEKDKILRKQRAVHLLLSLVIPEEKTFIEITYNIINKVQP